MRQTQALTCAIAALLIPCSACSPSKADAISTNDVIAIVGFSEADTGQRRVPSGTLMHDGDFSNPGLLKTFRGEDAALAFSQRLSRIACRPRVWINSRDAGASGSAIDQFGLGMTGWLGPDAYQIRVNNHDGIVFQHRTIRSLLSRIQTGIGLPFRAESVNHHGCRDALLILYRENKKYVGFLFYALKQGGLRMDVADGSNIYSIREELTKQ